MNTWAVPGAGSRRRGRRLLSALNFKKPASIPVAIKALRGLLRMSGDPDPRLLGTAEPPELGRLSG